MELPRELRQAMESELASRSSKKLAAIAAKLSERYRAGLPPGGGKLLQSQEDVAAYAAFRLPATYAAVYAAVGQVQDRLPGWHPNTVLDVGAGPGTAMWAAAALWPRLINRITLIEREEDMIDLGQRLAAHSSFSAVQEATWRRFDLRGKWAFTPHDLVIASYVLGEMPSSHSEAFIRKLWETTSHTLVIIEPGTPAGFTRIRQAREQLLDLGGQLTAPCPHDKPCPMSGRDWCHFAARVSRSRLHRQIKAGELAYEDEKFSFISMSRSSGTPIQGRVIRHPQVRTGLIRLELCTPQGLRNTVVTRKDREPFRRARNLRWGSAVLEPDDQE
ncbi:small ribosomal subunit Rsm22 family protein [Paenibacillus sp. J2TS4]|uniref:small ribosomal subunit Rsm22 family protein n=1 Tax=Paenibacillus sp. J2TS4 TaxID=2807194 RepID=UPI001B172B1D|nr:small ribosomal subunit Rsm22 family protein [Paenibacillus sp. J2TS4]GIP31895.1 rRNA methyltransferase [Paenibacillus sp. J2TS4]